MEGTRERLIRSVELRLRADVPLAFCMSGGIDSLSLISIARRVLDYDVHGFTIVNSDERYEEQDMVDHAVERLERAPHADSRRTPPTSCPGCAASSASTTRRSTRSPTTPTGC